MAGRSYENEVITTTVAIDSLLTGAAIGTLQEDFLLCEADFLRLKNTGTPLTSWSFNLLFASIGYLLNIIPKWLSQMAGKPDGVSDAEWIVLAIGFLLSGLLYLVGIFLKNERKELLDRMEQHFRAAPKSRQVIRRGE